MNEFPRMCDKMDELLGSEAKVEARSRHLGRGGQQ